MLQVTAAECELRLGRWDAGRGAAGAAAGAQPRRRAAARRVRLLTAIRARQGDFAAAAALEREATALLAANVAPQPIVSTNTARAEFARLRGDPEAAQAIVCDTHADDPLGRDHLLPEHAAGRHPGAGGPRRARAGGRATPTRSSARAGRPSSSSARPTGWARCSATGSSPRRRSGAAGDPSGPTPRPRPSSHASTARRGPSRGRSPPSGGSGSASPTRPPQHGCARRRRGSRPASARPRRPRSAPRTRRSTGSARRRCASAAETLAARARGSRCEAPPSRPSGRSTSPSAS